MARAVQHHHSQIIYSASLRVGDAVQVLQRGSLHVYRALCTRPDSDFLHVHERARVEHAAAVGHRHGRQRVCPPQRQQSGAVYGIHGDIHLRRVSCPQLLAVKQHWGIILFALADNDRSLHLDAVKHQPHRFHCGLVTTVFVVAPHKAPGRERSRLGHPHQFQRKVAVRLTTRHFASPFGAQTAACRSLPDRAGHAGIPFGATPATKVSL